MYTMVYLMYHMQVCIDLPLPDEQVFRYGAADEILSIVASDPSEVFTNRDLRRAADYGGPSVARALELLVSLDLLIRTDRENRTEYQINAERLTERTGVAAIPQAEFRAPVRRFREQVLEEAPDVEGLLIFGSVARGEADRQSDIDVFVAVETEPPMEARRAVTDIIADLESERFDGQRYGFDHHVESLHSIQNYGDRLAEIVTEGIPLYTTDEFDDLRHRILTAEERSENE